MTTQLTIDANALGPWRQGQPYTARQAAVDNYPRSGSQRQKVMTALVMAGEQGLTDYEASLQAGISRPHVAGTRRAELQRNGWVADSGLRRRTDTGSSAVVWKATVEGVEAWRSS